MTDVYAWLDQDRFRFVLREVAPAELSESARPTESPAVEAGTAHLPTAVPASSSEARE